STSASYQGDVDLSGSVDASAGASGAQAGRISVQAGMARTLALKGALDARATATSGTDGTIYASGCTVSLSGKMLANKHPGGRNEVTYGGSFTVMAAGQMRAALAGGNVVFCPCDKPDYALHACGTPQQCAVAPLKTSGPPSRPTSRPPRRRPCPAPAPTMSRTVPRPTRT